jgi:hypothetical protein
MSDPDGIRSRVLARLAEQRALVRSLLRLREQIQGSLFARYGECGKENCCCRGGRKHGPYYVLSTRGVAGAGFAYLDGPKLEAARELVRSYRDFRSGLRRLKRINLELVALLKRYQASVARKGGRRLRLLAQA